jgi:hypothetical protein
MGMGRKASHTLPSPGAISHTDYATTEDTETVKADGLDFEIIQPKSKSNLNRENGLLSPDSPALQLKEEGIEGRPGMKRSETARSDVSGVSARSLPLPETDEWGFLKELSVTPEMFHSRSQASESRIAEGKWVSFPTSSSLLLLSSKGGRYE